MKNSLQRTHQLFMVLVLSISVQQCKSDLADFPGPAIISTTPGAYALGVSRTQAIEVVFDIPVQPLTINGITFSVFKDNQPVAGTVAYSPNTARFVPSGTLAATSLYEVRITTGVKNLQGVPMKSELRFSFTTGL